MLHPALVDAEALDSVEASQSCHTLQKLSVIEDAQRLHRLTGIGPPGLKNSGSAIGATSFAAWTSLAIVLAHSVAETLARKQSATRIGAKSFGCNKRRSASPR